jgi:hypothetical protein
MSAPLGRQHGLSMSWNRMNEDSCEVWTEMRQSSGPGNYVLSRPLKCSAPFVADPQLSSQGAQVSVCSDRPLVDVDSELLGITRRAMRCPQGHYAAGTGACSLKHSRTDDRLAAIFEPESTRDSNPGCTLRGTGWNRFEWLCEDPQRFAEIPFETDVNYRAVVKDNHRPLIPKLLSDPSLPPPAPLCAPVNRTPCAGLGDLPPAPMRPHWRTTYDIAKIKGRA